MKLEQFLKIKGKKILLPINEYEFILTRKSAENIVVALRGALKRLTKHAPDADTWTCKKCTRPSSNFRVNCFWCGHPRQ